ncbi:MAG: histidine phosphatase family protein [Luteimonas sp.]
MRPIIRAVLLAGTFSAISCTSTVDSGLAALRSGPTFVVVRHAEKSADDPRDPTLSAAGTARAEALATRLGDRDVVAVYATGFRRTQNTARPTALHHGLTVTTYDAARPVAAFAQQLRDNHRSGAVLVVGHSNTVPGIVGALCGCSIAAIDEASFDRLYEVHFDAGGTASLREDRY